MFLEISKAEYIADFKIKLEFNNGETWTVNLENELNGSVFEPLRNKADFKNFSIAYNTIEWANGADFAPEYLYDIAKLQNQLASESTIDYKNSQENE